MIHREMAIGSGRVDLVIFDQRPEVSWDEKLFDVEVQSADGRTIHLFGA